MRLTLTLLALASVAADPPLAIRNAAVETLTPAGRVENATVVVRDGKIAAVGKDVPVPDDATVIDAAGGTLMPGVIDPYFEVAVAAATADTGARTIVFRGRTITLPAAPQRGGTYTRVADNFYPHDAGFKPLPRVGLTRLNLVTNGTGQAAVVRVTPAEPGRMLDRPDGVAYATVTNSTDSLDQVRSRLEAAKRATTRPTTASGKLWGDVLDGKVPLVAEAANPAAVLHLLRALEPYKSVKLVLYLGGDSVAETAPALKGRNVTAILRPGLDLLPNSRDRFCPARTLHEAGVEFAFSLSVKPPAAPPAALPTAAPEPETPPLTIDGDFPLFPVAVAVKAGLPRAAALEALAKRPAAVLGLAGTHGTVEPGKAADLLLFSGDPLDTAGRLRLTLVDGRPAYEAK